MQVSDNKMLCQITYYIIKNMKKIAILKLKYNIQT